MSDSASATSVRLSTDADVVSAVVGVRLELVGHQLGEPAAEHLVDAARARRWRSEQPTRSAARRVVRASMRARSAAPPARAPAHCLPCMGHGSPRLCELKRAGQTRTST